MALIDRILGRAKTLSELSPQELRREEILLTKQRDRLFKKIDDVGQAKQRLFKRGAEQKSPELRKALAMDFELKTQEQLMAARELNLRSKELLTVSRLKLVKENRGDGRALGRLKLTAGDAAKIGGWIESDAVTQDVYAERLDALLELGEQSERDALGTAGLSAAGQELMNLWGDLDRGTVAEGQAFERADQAVRRRQASSEREL